ncbi:MAG: rhomboid family intramembrane serine protease [Nannocystaceae bacterium]
MGTSSQAPITRVNKTQITTGGGPLDAQCPACSLHELVPIHLEQDADGRWRQLDPSRPAGDAALTIDTCPVCFGVWLDQDEIDVLGDVDIDPAFLKTLVGQSANRMCPRGHGFMNEHVIPELLKTPIDRCPVCRGLWLDGDERYSLAKSSTREGQGDRNVELAKRGLIWAAQILTQLPVEVENPARGTPWVVYGLSAALIACYVASVLGLVYARDFAMIAGQIIREPSHAYTLVTHIFFHADWYHLLGNLYFLYVFGDNVEHIYGHRRFLLLFLGAGLVGGVAQFVLTKATATPVIGASGAIAAVMGAYLWIFPKAKLLQIVPIVYVQLKIPAWVYVLLWMVAQAFFGFFSDAMGTAWFSHLFGAVFGLAMTPWVLQRRRAEVSERVRFRSARAIFGDRLAKRPAPGKAAAAPPPTPTTFGIPKTSSSQTAGRAPSASGSFTQAGAPVARGQGFGRKTRGEGEPPAT